MRPFVQSFFVQHSFAIYHSFVNFCFRLFRSTVWKRPFEKNGLFLRASHWSSELPVSAHRRARKSSSPQSLFRGKMHRLFCQPFWFPMSDRTWTNGMTCRLPQ
jgi:hypothetical protein